MDKGFTLIELTITTVIVSIVVLAATELNVQQTREMAKFKGEAEAQTLLNGTMSMISRDIQKAGLGVRWVPEVTDLAMSADLKTEQNIIINDFDGAVDPTDLSGQGALASAATFLGGPLMAGSDQLILAGTDMPLDAASRGYGQITHLVNSQTLILRRSDATEFFVEKGRVVIVNAYHERAVTAGGAQTFQIAAVNTAGEDVTLTLVESIFDVSQIDGGEVYSISDLGNGAATPPLYKVHWALTADGYLVRSLFWGTAPNDYTKINRQTMLTDIKDFQVSFTAWPCDAVASDTIETHHMDTIFGNGAWFTTDPIRFRAQRARLHGVRVSVLAEVPLSAATYYAGRNAHLIPGQTTLDLQNNVVAGLTADNAYVIEERFVEPFNYRTFEPNAFINSNGRNRQSQAGGTSCRY